ncbi:DUF1285 domain-containing protein [Spongiibacter nanhainus]|uniref:DUF1285 domain-containing protein n=1 Tax=Spongiibacter nanhainus TaxID=2794344 RepID=A0A7T4URM9_9GAMM|nr:DUF1285 domain-containing protein [Spongiibacter nanhainus]QQD19896.1 DUF1285 domain-containing protein [Spongiibacter nanhainus]
MASLEHLETLLADQRGRPPIEKWHPEFSGDIDIVIRRDGSWWHEGGEIRRFELVKLFASILRRESDGEYYLVTPVEKWRITVEDLPLSIVDVECASDHSRIAVKTNVEEWLELGASHPLTVHYQPGSDEPQPSVRVRHGVDARVNRSCFYRMVEMGEQEQDQLILTAGGETFVLGPI